MQYINEWRRLRVALLIVAEWTTIAYYFIYHPLLPEQNHNTQYCSLATYHRQGNPVCREVEYRFTVLAYIKNITYHDYATVDPAEVAQV